MWNSVRQLNLLTHALYAMTLLMLAIAGAYWVTQRPVFVLRSIVIDGDVEHINEPAVRTWVLRQLRGNFLTVKLKAIRLAFEAMPWVRRANVRRIWPNQLVVSLEAYRALGIWGSDRLVSVDGEVFTASQAEAAGNLPHFNGPSGSEREVVARYYDLTHWLAPLGAKLQTVTLSARYAWTVTLTNGMRIEYGRERSQDTLADRTRRLIAAWPQVKQQWGGHIEYVDLRYPNGFALHATGMQFADQATDGSDNRRALKQ